MLHCAPRWSRASAALLTWLCATAAGAQQGPPPPGYQQNPPPPGYQQNPPPPGYGQPPPGGGYGQPPPGGGWYYLVSGLACGAEGPVGADSLGGLRLVAACP